MAPVEDSNHNKALILLMFIAFIDLKDITDRHESACEKNADYWMRKKKAAQENKAAKLDFRIAKRNLKIAKNKLKIIKRELKIALLKLDSFGNNFRYSLRKFKACKSRLKADRLIFNISSDWEFEASFNCWISETMFSLSCEALDSIDDIYYSIYDDISEYMIDFIQLDSSISSSDIKKDLLYWISIVHNEAFLSNQDHRCPILGVLTIIKELDIPDKIRDEIRDLSLDALKDSSNETLENFVHISSFKSIVDEIIN